jgi:hypothetical protein
MTRWLVGFTCAVVVAMAGSALAHHSAGAIDRTKSLTLNGTVKEFRWANPHSWIDLDVPNDKGSVETWSVEMTSPTFLVRAGWKSTTLKKGDKVSVTVRPLRSGEPGGVFVSVTLADGKVLGERAGGPPAGGPPPAK